MLTLSIDPTVTVAPTDTVNVLLTPTTISPVEVCSPVRVVSLILISSATKPAYLVNVDTPSTSKSVVLYVPSTLKSPRPPETVSVPIPTPVSYTHLTLPTICSV